MDAYTNSSLVSQIVIGQRYGGWLVLERRLGGFAVECQCGSLNVRNATDILKNTYGCRLCKFSNSNQKRAAYCIHCEKEFLSSRRGSNRCQDCMSIIRRFKSLGIDATIDQYIAAVKRSNGCCEGCGVKAEKRALDHDHKTKKFRGLLCMGCNFAEGLFKKDPEGLTRLKEYMLRHA